MTPDIIGKIVDTPAVVDEQTGEVKQEATFIDGYHVNFPQEVPELAQYKLDPQPKTPVRIYAGGIKPVCYVFADEAEWEAVNPSKQEKSEVF